MARGLFADTIPGIRLSSPWTGRAGDGVNDRRGKGYASAFPPPASAFGGGAGTSWNSFAGRPVSGER